MAKKKTTIYLDENVLRAVKVRAARKGQREYEVFDEALRAFLGLDVVSQTWKKSKLKAEEALKLAYREIHEARR